MSGKRLPEEHQEAIRERLRLLLKDVFADQKQAAKALGIDQATISKAINMATQTSCESLSWRITTHGRFDFVPAYARTTSPGFSCGATGGVADCISTYTQYLNEWHQPPPNTPLSLLPASRSQFAHFLAKLSQAHLPQEWRPTVAEQHVARLEMHERVR